MYNLTLYIKAYSHLAPMSGSCISIGECFLFSHVKYFSQISIVNEHHSSLFPESTVLKESKLNVKIFYNMIPHSFFLHGVST